MATPSSALGRALWGVGAVAIGAALWGVWGERTRYQLREETLPILPAGAASIRILQLSDLHLAPWHRSAVSWVQSLADTQPDLIIGTGDFYGHPDALPTISDALHVFAGVPGVVVHGSNDFVAPRPVNPLTYLRENSGGSLGDNRLDFEGLHRLYTDTLGWHDIDNGAVALTIGDQVIECVGVGDAHIQRDDLAAVTGVVEQMRENTSTPRSKPPVTIGVTHAPYRKVLNTLVTQGADLIVAGHTHGGQVQVPGLGALTTNCDLPTRFARGLHRWHHGSRSSWLNVSAGIGTSIYAPVRFACPPEAVLLTLVASDIGYA